MSGSSGSKLGGIQLSSLIQCNLFILRRDLADISSRSSSLIYVWEKKPIALIHVRENKPIALIHVREKKLIALIPVREKDMYNLLVMRSAQQDGRKVSLGER